MANLDQATLQNLINAAAGQAGLDPALLRAVQLQENAQANPAAIGPKPAIGNERAVGLMQILPSVAQNLGIDPTDPAQAMNGAATLLAQNLQRYNGDVAKAVQAYHGGTDPANWGPRTASYLQKVSQNFQTIKANQAQTGFAQPIAAPQPSAPNWTDALFAGNGGQATAPNAGSWTDALFQPATTAAVPATAPAAKAAAHPPSTLDQMQHALSFGTRNVLEGLGKGAGLVYDPVANVINQLGGAIGHNPNIAPLGQQANQLANQLGLDTPQNARERIYSQAQQIGTSALPMIASGQALRGVASPAAQALGDFLAQHPVNQMTGAAGAGAGQQYMAEQGGGPGWQTVGMLGGGAAGSAIPSLLNRGAQAARGLLAPTRPQLPPPVEPTLGEVPPDVPPTVPVPGKPHIVLKSAAQQAAEAASSSAQQQALQELQTLPPQSVSKGMAPVADDSANVVATLANGLLQARQNAFEALGLTDQSGATAGMLSRDPKQWQLENNAARVANAEGSQLAARYANINQGLRDAAEQVKSGTAAQAQTPFDAMQNVQNVLGQKYDEMQQAVGQQYQAVRDAVGSDAVVQPAALTDTLNQFRDTTGADSLLGSTLRWMRSRNLIDPDSLSYDQARGWNFQLNPDTAISVPQAEELRKLVGNEMQGGGPSARMAGRNLIDALDNDVIQSTGNDAFAQARAAARARFQEFGNPLLDRMVNQDPNPEALFRTTALSGDPRNLQALKNSLQSGTTEQITRGRQAWNDVRGQVVDQLIGAAFGPDGTGQFNSGGFTRALNQIGMPKLQILFNPQEIATLGSISRVGKLAFQAPSFANPNYSNTAAGIYDVLNKSGIGQQISDLGTKLGQLPVLGKLATPLAAGAGYAIGGAPGAAVGAGVMSTLKSGVNSLKEAEAAKALQSALHPDVAALNSALVRQQTSKIKPLLERLPMSHLGVSFYNALHGGAQP